MWEVLEIAQNAAIEAELTRDLCKKLCLQSDEENTRMKEEIRKNLEFRIDHERFWVKELEARVSSLKECREDLVQAKIRLEKSINTCKQGGDVTSGCCRTLKNSELNENAGRIQLLSEEMKLFEENQGILSSIFGAIVEIDKGLEEACKLIESDLHNKYVAMNKDQQSVALKLHSPQLLSLVSNANQTCLCPSTSQMADLETRNEKIVGQSDRQISSCKLFLAQMEEVVSKLTEKLMIHIKKVNNVLQDRLADLKNSKSDLENHLSLVDTHSGNTEETIERLKKTLSDKESAILLVEGQLQLHRSRPKTELCVDRVGMTLERKLTESRNEWRTLSAQLPMLEKTLRSLRRSRLQILADIGEHSRKIAMEELQCLNARIALENIRL